MHIQEDTICAPATAPGQSAIAVIRVSGPQSIEITDKIFRGKTKLADRKSHTVTYGKILAAGGETIDDVCVSVFRGPNSYTGEDTTEISLHGNPLIVEETMALLLRAGARTAQAGEFSRRAYLNGKLDLLQAEAVTDIITARSQAALRGARDQRDGVLSERITRLRRGLLDLTAMLELDLDFTEEDIDIVSRKEAIKVFDSSLKDIDELLSTYSFGRLIRDGVEVAIVGPANSGKSSLLNFLLKENRAIVSDIAGTTRDVLREEITIDGLLFHFHDTAGIRKSRGKIEQQGIEKSTNAAAAADIVLFMSDAKRGFAQKAYDAILAVCPEERIITVMNKIDIQKPKTKKSQVRISAKTGAGIDELLNLLKNTALSKNRYCEHSAVLANKRQFIALEEARKSLIAAKDAFAQELSSEFTALDLRAALQHLEEITGAFSTDDTLNHIFDNFCIGK